jgi:hypothetical protein
MIEEWDDAAAVDIVDEDTNDEMGHNIRQSCFTETADDDG